MNLNDKSYSKLKWTPQVLILQLKEEDLLRNLKQIQKMESWKKIANQMNLAFLSKNRSGKQCRERYMNYVRFGKESPKMCGWSPPEDQMLFVKFMEHGAKWVQIGKEMPGRSQNCLKNRFYGAMRKIIRKINRTAKQKKLRQKKPIKAELLIRILEHPIQTTQNNQMEFLKVSQFLEELKISMIKIAIKPEQNSSLDEIQALIKGISKFSSNYKNFSTKKNPSNSLEESYEKIDQNQASRESSSNQLLEDMEQVISEEIKQILVQKDSNGLKHKIKKNIILLGHQMDRHPSIFEQKQFASLETETLSASIPIRPAGIQNLFWGLAINN